MGKDDWVTNIWAKDDWATQNYQNKHMKKSGIESQKFTAFLSKEFPTFSVKMHNKKFTKNSDQVVANSGHRSKSTVGADYFGTVIHVLQQ